jgi:hypothetical protein
MEAHQSPAADKPAPRRPWNKGKPVGAKPTLRPVLLSTANMTLRPTRGDRRMARISASVYSRPMRHGKKCWPSIRMGYRRRWTAHFMY